MRTLRLATASLFCALFATAISARAQVADHVLADHVPADAIAYAGWAGADSLGDPYNASHLKAFLDVLKLPQLISSQVQQGLAGQANAQQRENAQLLQDLLTILAKSPTAVFMQPFDFPDNAPPVPKVALIAKLPPGTFVNIPPLSALISQNRGPNAPRVGIVKNGSYLEIFLGRPDIPDPNQPAPNGGLAASPAFQKALQHLSPNAAKSPALAYIDAAAALKTFTTAVDKSDNTQAQRLLAPLVSLGLGGLTQIAFAGNFDGPDWRNTLFVGMTQKRDGFLFLLDSPNLPDAELRLIPKSATTAASFRFDGVKLLQVLNDVANAATNNGGQRIDQGLNQIWTFTGIDLKADLFPALGDSFLMYASPDAAGNSIRGFTLINRLRDAKKGQTAMNEITTFTNAALQQRNPNSPQFITQTLPDPWGSVTAHVINLPQASPAWAIHDDILYFALSIPALQDALDMTTGKKPSLLENPQFLATRKRLADRPFSAFMFEDLAGSAPETYQLVTRALAQSQPLIANRIPTLPPLDQITSALGPALSITWTDADGYHLDAISPFLGAGYLNPFELIGLTLNQQTAAPARGRFPAPGDALP